MTSRYSVLQYMPDPSSGERVNVAVVVWDEERAVCRFTNNWRRLRPIVGDRLDSIQEFAEGLQTAAETWRPGEAGGFYEAVVERFVGNWASCIEFTAPRGSLKNATSALPAVSSVFLSMLVTVKDRRRTRSTAVAMAVRALRVAVTERLSEEASAEAVVLRPIVNGALEKHTIDAALRNGRILSGVHALSFETSEPGRLRKDVESTAWVIDDIRKSAADVRLSVFALPPTQLTQEAFCRASRLFHAMKVPLVDEAELPRWAATQANELAEHLGLHASGSVN